MCRALVLFRRYGVSGNLESFLKLPEEAARRIKRALSFALDLGTDA
jgi:hypothetical protein